MIGLPVTFVHFLWKIQNDTYDAKRSNWHCSYIRHSFLYTQSSLIDFHFNVFKFCSKCLNKYWTVPIMHLNPWLFNWIDPCHPLDPTWLTRVNLRVQFAVKERRSICIPFSAAVSTVMPPLAAFVKNVPNFRPATMSRTAFSVIPLHMTTETPLSSAQHAERTCKHSHANRLLMTFQKTWTQYIYNYTYTVYSKVQYPLN